MLLPPLLLKKSYRLDCAPYVFDGDVERLKTAIDDCIKSLGSPQITLNIIERLQRETMRSRWLDVPPDDLCTRSGNTGSV